MINVTAECSLSFSLRQYHDVRNVSFFTGVSLTCMIHNREGSKITIREKAFDCGDVGLKMAFAPSGVMKSTGYIRSIGGITSEMHPNSLEHAF